jgi:hypothetical protein
MKFVLPALAAASLLFAATALQAQETSGPSGAANGSSANSSVPGAAPNGTTPGALGNSPHSLDSSGTGGCSGLGYDAIDQGLGVTPGSPGSPTYNPNAALPQTPNSSSSGSGAGSSTSSGAGGTGSSSGG